MGQARQEKLKLMVVDDEPDNLDLLYRTFRREFKVFKADGAVSALNTLEEEGEMAIIISDQRMPVMNGTEFLSKTVERYPETIRILLTGYTDVEDLVDAINSGKVFKYITKPWTPDHLKAVVDQAKDTYILLKQRTNELRRSLKREELFNIITTTIRESLDYDNMLQTIVDTIGKNFEATYSLLKTVEDRELTNNIYAYKYPINKSVVEDQNEGNNKVLGEENYPLSDPLMNLVFKTGEIKIVQESNNEENCIQLALPIIFQKEILAILYLYHQGKENPWSASEIKLLEAVSEQAALAISQAKLYQQIQQQAQKMSVELEVARQIQYNLLRQTWEQGETVKVQAQCYPARQVGGDFFEVYYHPQGDVWICLGDVSGKGVPAALFMASALSILRRELVQEISPDPEDVLKNLNKAMADDLFSSNCFITMVIARYTPNNKKLIYANAGHIYPMVWSHQKLQQELIEKKSVSFLPQYLKDRGIPIGILPQWRGKIGQMELNKGEIFLLTSDGITEATLAENNLNNTILSQPNGMLNQEGLWQLISRENNAFELDHLLKIFHQVTSQVQEDDQTIVSLEVL
jgi:serine phosphatase RsbU (regulator of sigma subunit)/FixJ family two-component response regulator